MHNDLDAEKTVYENITDGLDNIQLGNKAVNGRAYVSKFNFNGGDQQKKGWRFIRGRKERVYTWQSA
jgi:sulfate-transporting ATPase